MMNGLSLDLFTKAGSDIEGAQYRVLSSLQQVHQAFSQNIIYPYLGELIDLYSALQALIQQINQFREALPGQIRKIDLETQTVVKEHADLGTPELKLLEDLVQWALPQLRNAIEEGRTIFEFVEENQSLEEVGIVPSYVEEGYLILPDLQHQTHHILTYQLSIFADAHERYRTLKTTHLKQVTDPIIGTTPRGIKLALMQEFRDLPNPATYFCATDLDFPYEPTVLPVAKRKLMRYLYLQGGAA
jgi:hypothetical protein